MSVSSVHRHASRKRAPCVFRYATSLRGAPLQVNSGAIMVCSLVRHGLEQSARFRAIMETWAAVSGRQKYVSFSNSTYLSERATADRNFCLGYMMQGQCRGHGTGAANGDAAARVRAQAQARAHTRRGGEESRWIALVSSSFCVFLLFMIFSCFAPLFFPFVSLPPAQSTTRSTSVRRGCDTCPGGTGARTTW